MAITLAKNTVFNVVVTSTPHQILGVTELTVDGREWGNRETTNHDNSTPVKTFGGTLLDNGTATLTYFYNHSDTYHAQLDTWFDGQLHDFSIVHVYGVTETFQGIITSLNVTTDVSDYVIAKAVIKVSGSIVKS